MPSRYYSWAGRCTDTVLRQDLMKRLKNLRKGHREINQVIEGDILLSPELANQFAPELLKRKPVKKTPSFLDQIVDIVDEMQNGAVVECSHDDEFVHLSEAHVEGIILDVPRPDCEVEASFVCLTSSEHPQLDGLLVIAEDAKECAYYRDQRIQRADWFLAYPNITLRYMCEGWFEILLHGIKHFYIPELVGTDDEHEEVITRNPDLFKDLETFWLEVS